MSRLDARWGNFNLRGRVWDHFWQDTKAGGSQNLTRTAADTLGAVSESVARGRVDWVRTSSASIASLTETATRAAAAKTRTGADSLSSLGESVARTAIAFARTSSASIASLAESPARSAIALARTTSDSIATLSESVARSVLILLRAAADSLGAISEAVDAQKSSGSQHLDRTADDSLASLSESADRSVGIVRSAADGLTAFIWGGSLWGSGDAYGGISESVSALVTPSGPVAYVRTVDDDIASIDEATTIPTEGVPTQPGDTRRRRRTLWFPTQHLERGIADAVEFLYADAAVAVTESDEWVVLDMPELVL